MNASTASRISKMGVWIRLGLFDYWALLHSQAVAVAGQSTRL